MTKERPEFVFLAAAKVGGILANSNYKADFIFDNLTIQNNVIKNAHLFNVEKLLFLGSSWHISKKRSSTNKRRVSINWTFRNNQ